MHKRIHQSISIRMIELMDHRWYGVWKILCVIFSQVQASKRARINSIVNSSSTSIQITIRNITFFLFLLFSQSRNDSVMLCMCIKYLSFSTLNIDLFSLIAFVRFGFNTHTHKQHNTTTEVNEELLTKRRLNIRKFFYYVQLRAVQLFSCALFFWPRELSYPCTNKHSHTHKHTKERQYKKKKRTNNLLKCD